MLEMRLSFQFAVGLVFLLSSLSKLASPARFAQGVVEYQILPKRLAFILGLLLIPWELLLAISHLTGWFLAVASPAAVVTLLIFVIAVGINLRRGRTLSCHCFGGGGEQISGSTLARLLLLIVAELFVLSDPAMFDKAASTSVNRTEGTIELVLLFLWSVFLLVAAFWLLSLKDLTALLRPCSTCGTQQKVEPPPAQ